MDGVTRARMGAAAFSVGLGVAFVTGHGVAGADTDTSQATSHSSSDTVRQARTSGSAGNGSVKRTSQRQSKVTQSGPARAFTALSKLSRTAVTSPNSIGAADNAKAAPATNRVAPAPLAAVVTASGRTMPNLTAVGTPNTVAAAHPSTQTTSTTLAIAPNPLAVAVSGLISSVFASLGIGGTTTPLSPVDALSELVYVARREFQSTFFNSRPTMQPVQLAQNAGTVIGTVNAQDVDGDTITFAVTGAPTHGTVVINTDGTYVYTPSDPAAGVTDSFQVTATDSGGLNLASIVGSLFGGGDPHTTVATVAVNIDPHALSDVAVGTDPGAVAVSADNKRAYVVNSGSNTVSVVDIGTGSVEATIQVGNRPSAVAVGDNAVYVANMFDNSVSVINTESNTVIATIGVGDAPRNMTLSADGAQLYVANTNSATVSVIDTATAKVVDSIGVGGDPTTVVATPDGATLYVGNATSGSVAVVDTATGVVTGRIDVKGNVQAMALSPDGKSVYVAGYDTGGVAVIDTATRTVTTEFAVGSYPDAIAVSHDGTRLYVTTEQDNAVVILDAGSLRRVGVVKLGDTGSAVAVSVDDTSIYVPNPTTNTLSVTHLNPIAAPPTAVDDSSPVGARNAVDSIYFYNLTTTTIHLNSYDSRGFGLISGPDVGTDLPPGGYVRFDIWDGKADVLTYWVTVDGDSPNTLVRLEASSHPVTVGHCLINPGADLNCGNSTDLGNQQYAVNIVGAKGSTLTVGSDRPDLQAAILNELCTQDYNCSFVGQSNIEASSNYEQVTEWERNPTDANQLVKYTNSNTISQSDSIQVTVKIAAKLSEVVNAELTAQYGHTWTNSTTYSIERDETLLPHTEGAIFGTIPIYEVHGDFYIIADGQTFVLKDAVFDTPIDDNSKTSFTFESQPLPPSNTSVT
jgi:YVTN family beta-propeller protein/VCBS repeat-containing protein